MGLDGIYLHDPTALVAVLAPQLFGWNDGAVRVSCEGIARGKTLMDTGAKKCAPSGRTRCIACSDAAPLRSWVGENDWKGRPKCSVALSVDAPGVLALVMQLLSRKGA